MWHELGWAASRVLLGFVLPVAIIAVAVDQVRPSYVALIGLGFVALTIAELVKLRLLASSAHEAAAGLGPAGTDAAPDRRSRPSLAGRTMRPAMLRLDRSWREHAASGEARVAAGEAVISAVPEPLILIDRRP